MADLTNHLQTKRSPPIWLCRDGWQCRECGTIGDYDQGTTAAWDHVDTHLKAGRGVAENHKMTPCDTRE